MTLNEFLLEGEVLTPEEIVEIDNILYNDAKQKNESDYIYEIENNV